MTTAAVGAACGGNAGNEPGGGGSGAGSGGVGAGGPSNSGPASSSSGDIFGGDGGDLNLGGNSPTGGDGGTGAGQACATQTATTELQPVYLAFAFDVSGSMGANNEPWHDRTLKWDPIVAATKQFFADPESEGLTASLTFFPSGRNTCSTRSYERPDVAMTPLPSEDFADAIDEITPETDDDWRMGTPTAFVVGGTFSFIEERRAENPGKYVIVLVTDGYPQLCNNENSINAVVARVETALESNVSTYVIGVANPDVEDAPDNVSNLHDIAAAGGTGDAFVIDTGDPDATAAAFNAAIDQIRGSAISCTLPIPAAPDGRTFDKQRVRVTYTSGTNPPTTLDYDQECEAESAWRYDNPQNPTQIVLCDSTCGKVQADPAASLGVDFTCEDVIQIPL
ncbi:VWA domain-containing protein [Sorangium cellulosum]|uniref:VWA domain-containing protein n=1 Tax=Sorangium cellulosum TaxID=56 RepID=UPI0030B83178